MVSRRSEMVDTYILYYALHSEVRGILVTSRPTVYLPLYSLLASSHDYRKRCLGDLNDRFEDM